MILPLGQIQNHQLHPETYFSLPQPAISTNPPNNNNMFLHHSKTLQENHRLGSSLSKIDTPSLHPPSSPSVHQLDTSRAERSKFYRQAYQTGGVASRTKDLKA